MLERIVKSILGVVLLFAAISTPALAHTEHKKKQEQAQQLQQPASPGGQRSAAMPDSSMAGHGQMGEMMDPGETGRSSLSFAARLLDWLGRLHPMVVHFPIAFFPAALFTAIVGRRRPAFAAPVQFLVVAGGLIAPIAAGLGWLDAMNADPDPLLAVHRWLGTAIGVGGLLLALWAWRRPWQDRGPGMIVALAVMTVAIVVQGWFGGALVHGLDHLDW